MQMAYTTNMGNEKYLQSDKMLQFEQMPDIDILLDAERQDCLNSRIWRN